MAKDLIYGLQPVLQVLRANRRRAFRLWMHREEQGAQAQEILRLARASKLAAEPVDRHQLSQISDSTQHQGFVLEVDGYVYYPFERLLQDLKKKQNGVVLLLDQIQDPQNLGAILRTAHCAGVDAVVIPERGSAEVTRAVLKSSAGAAEWMKVCLVKNLVRAIEDLKQIPLWIYGTDAESSSTYLAQDYKGGIAFVMGSEGEGLRKLVRENCDFLVSVPIVGKTGSLNVSVATGVLLFEVLRQRQENPSVKNQ